MGSTSPHCWRRPMAGVSGHGWDIPYVQVQRYFRRSGWRFMSHLWIKSLLTFKRMKRHSEQQSLLGQTICLCWFLLLNVVDMVIVHFYGLFSEWWGSMPCHNSWIFTSLILKRFQQGVCEGTAPNIFSLAFLTLVMCYSVIMWQF